MEYLKKLSYKFKINDSSNANRLGITPCPDKNLILLL